MDWQRLFVGRDADLKVLSDAYREARSGVPRVVAIVAESGFGKTRLAQEFFGWLSTDQDAAGSSGYWPDRLLRREDNLQVNPDIKDCGGAGGRMPFLWWGLRLTDPGSRNQVLEGALTPGVAVLRAHLEACAREVEVALLRRRQLFGGGKAAGDIAISVTETVLEGAASWASFGLLGIGKTLISEGLEQRKVAREIGRLEERNVSPGASERRARDTLTETILEDLHRIAKAPPEGFAAVPLVILVDDAHWLPRDPGTAAFLRALVRRARDDA